jgi:hypothetical protein
MSIISLLVAATILGITVFAFSRVIVNHIQALALAEERGQIADLQNRLIRNINCQETVLPQIAECNGGQAISLVTNSCTKIVDKVAGTNFGRLKVDATCGRVPGTSPNNVFGITINYQLTPHNSFAGPPQPIILPSFNMFCPGDRITFRDGFSTRNYISSIPKYQDADDGLRVDNGTADRVCELTGNSNRVSALVGNSYSSCNDNTVGWWDVASSDFVVENACPHQGNVWTIFSANLPESTVECVSSAVAQCGVLCVRLQKRLAGFPYWRS